MKKSGSVRKVLIRGTNWVGDAVMSVPAMREIRRVFPEAHISLLVRPWVRDIYSAVDFVDEILDYDKTGIHRGMPGFRKLASDLKSRNFDLAILLQNAFEAAFLAWYARIPSRVGYARDGRSPFLTSACKIPAEVRRVHQAHYYLALLSEMKWIPGRLWAQKDFPLPIQIGVRQKDAEAARDMLRVAGIREGETIIGVNPGAFYGSAKRWFPERYAAVADSLSNDYRARIVIFGSSSDAPIAEEVARRMGSKAVILAGKTTLGQLMGLLKSCRLLVTNDSGPMHLAAALDVPQLAIFGSTSEIATGPLSRYARVVKHSVSCSPCFLRDCPTDFRCMKSISVREVLEEARKVLETVAGCE